MKKIYYIYVCLFHYCASFLLLISLSTRRARETSVSLVSIPLPSIVIRPLSIPFFTSQDCTDRARDKDMRSFTALLPRLSHHPVSRI